jgi:hypothetical protein
MRKLTLAGVMGAAMIGAGFFAWQAEATTPAGAAATLGAAAKNYSPIKEVACRGWGVPLPAWIYLELRCGSVLVPALLGSPRSPQLAFV